MSANQLGRPLPRDPHKRYPHSCATCWHNGGIGHHLDGLRIEAKPKPVKVAA